jgi:Tat protein translocase TatB subunit
MFEFGFWELMVICVVALLVLGPTRLPGLVRKVGRWVGKARSMARDFREQLENEVNLEELNRATRQQAQAWTPPEPAPADAPPAPADTPSDTAPNVQAEAQPLSTYPYGTPTNIDPAPPSSIARSADPAVLASESQPGDDTFSHAHEPGGAPQPWSPEPDSAPDTAAESGGSDSTNKPVA